MIEKLEIYLDNKWSDYTSCVNQNGVVRQSRCDEAFATGSLQLWCNRDTNIPPYSIMRINGEEYWLCSSTSHRYLTKNSLYIHDVLLLELTAILSCYILGSKAFSITGTHTYDYEKVYIICELMSQKYGVNFDFDGSESILNKQQEFVFGPGTTMYDALIEIIKSYQDTKLKVISYDEANSTFSLSITTTCEEIGINEDRIVSESFNQNSEEYGAILESEMTNVIDRSNTIVVSHMSLRADEVHMTEDNSCLILPTRIESVKTFKVRFNQYLESMIITLGEDCENVGALGETHSFGEWLTNLEAHKEILNRVLYFKDYLIQRTSIDYSALKESSWSFSKQGSSYKLYLNPNEITMLSAPIDITSLILPIDKWNMLPDKDKPKYVYYSSGSNRIEGMNNYYKNDFWSTLTGYTVNPFLQESGIYVDTLPNERIYYNDDSSSGIYMTGVIDPQLNHPTLEHCFDIEYYPIIDPLVSDEKEGPPKNGNESIIKKISRSYDKNSNYIDFDRMINSLRINNNTTGLPECTIEYIANKGNIIPRAGAIIQRYGNEWYVASVVCTSNYGSSMVTLNLVSNYNKVAEAIGLKSQYNAVKNPLQGIIDRPLLYQVSFENRRYLPNNIYAKITLYDDANIFFKKTLYKRAVLMVENGVTYAYVEAYDQYALDNQAVRVNDSNYSINAVSYCNEFNEISRISISLGTISSLTREESLKLPVYEGDLFQTLVEPQIQKVYKDSRERLIFTFKMDNCEVHDTSVKSFFINVSADFGVASWSIERISSPQENELGSIYNGSIVNVGDVLVIDAVPKDGYKIKGSMPKRIIVSQSEGETFRIDISSVEVMKGKAPILEMSYTHNSIENFDEVTYKVTNPNTCDVSAQINIYVDGDEADGDTPYNIVSQSIKAGGTYKSTFNTRLNYGCSIYVTFRSNQFSSDTYERYRISK